MGRDKVKKLAHQQARELGEALALAKLNSLGYAAYASPAGALGHDLMVVVDHGTLSIEVKTRQHINSESEISRWPVLMKTKGDADLFLFVALNITTMSPNTKRTYRAGSSGCGCWEVSD